MYVDGVASNPTVVYKVIAVNISYRGRLYRWPSVFGTSDYILVERSNMGPVAAQADDGGAVRDLIFRYYHILYGDLEADRLGVKTVYKTGDKLDKYLS